MGKSNLREVLEAFGSLAPGFTHDIDAVALLDEGEKQVFRHELGMRAA